MNRLNRPFSLLILAVSLSLSGVSSASATDYYVSTSGSDSNDGSAAHPWATIAHASSVVGPGAIVHVAPGTYSGQFNTDASGTSSAYITYVSDTKWGAKIAGGSSSTWSNHGAYVTIQGFDAQERERLVRLAHGERRPRHLILIEAPRDQVLEDERAGLDALRRALDAGELGSEGFETVLRLGGSGLGELKRIVFQRPSRDD